VVKRSVDAVKPEALLSAAHVYWDVEIQLKINVMGLGSSGNSSSFLSPYAVNQLTDNYHQAGGLLLQYHLDNLDQMQELRDELGSTGIVTNIRIKKNKD
jgi:hypothetical protein